MKKFKVLYLINYAPNYRDKFLRELGKHVDLTVTSYAGKEANLTDPKQRVGYNYVQLKRKKILGINLNPNEFTLGNQDFDVIIVGYTLWNPYRMLNLLRNNKRVICEGLIYGRNNGLLTKILRKKFIEASEGVLVYSQMVKDKLAKETKKPIIIFNNTSFSKNEIKKVDIPQLCKRLNIIWIGRYQDRKKVERLYELAYRNKMVNVRLIGPGIREKFSQKELPENFEIFDSAYDTELEQHFAWSHVVFNPGGAGLIIMNAARMGRSIVIDRDSHHGPEIQLALDAKQDFIDFSNTTEVDSYINKIFENEKILSKKGDYLYEKMHNYTIEYMADMYLKAIRGEWL